MSPNALLLTYALVAVLTLIVLIARFKLHPFVALIAVSIACLLYTSPSPRD